MLAFDLSIPINFRIEIRVMHILRGGGATMVAINVLAPSLEKMMHKTSSCFQFYRCLSFLFSSPPYDKRKLNFIQSCNGIPQPCSSHHTA